MHQILARKLRPTLRENPRDDDDDFLPRISAWFLGGVLVAVGTIYAVKRHRKNAAPPIAPPLPPPQP